MNTEDRLRNIEITQKELKRQINAIYIIVFKMATKQGIKVGA